MTRTDYYLTRRRPSPSKNPVVRQNLWREDKMENSNQNPNTNDPPSSFVIKIPSYEEVIQSQSQPPAQSLFKSSQTFTQAFKSIKNSEFYVPPPSSSSSQSQSRDSSTPAANQAGASSSSAQNRNAILVSNRQKGNPLLKHIRNVRWAFSDIVCDYMLGKNSCALYLSLRYHLLHPDYLYYRIRELGKNFKLRVVLCHVDVEDVVKPLLEVTRTALLHDCTLLCGWSLEECGRYLETIKVYENKPADLIQGQMDTDYLSRLSHALTSVRHVNKTDVVTLGSTFGSLSHIMDASMEDLARCPGIGERKVKRLYDTFHEPFKRTIPKHPSKAETSAQQFTPSEVKEDEKETSHSSKRNKKESDLTVKSALSAAFAKYKEKVGMEPNHQQEHQNQKQ
ncbi:putative ERCC1/RAD10/SWI10 family, RuvA domain 2, restriction endonuclease type II [Helianthus annuus]|uniref:DNA excision repair protein ERCC-1 n=2 Tax=Helianthus annuus TaxID=4232 RepID=A0A251S6G2_HELAN|nr:putative ERCC1/RAD10/SWI10 family, RuvA domain 2, restriction endonuclease type II [Helianthus annuus]KAJ0451869.1 putative ERCC1/RAD10/SWI10 family, RuvA domain 2, restriction endonuclease type II [Helianthus annuus]KAJ0456578.1 putative ERCC1/RAD10/SWI10 family, RuvA domain 2, restriction endonuclease type II [Helianthus annuus]KAJ0473754.1 putative ERCC1/RAD10/SWI10 family, RuvA domain 2, restriction endonuclease type II [Helianthus annuus]KAJ0649330.1 putative ERCC1/RAD10/SWI10 family, R